MNLATAAERRQWLAHGRPVTLRIVRGCALMGVARSSYYAQGNSLERAAEPDAMVLRERIEAICAEVPFYGYRRVAKQPKADGW